MIARVILTFFLIFLLFPNKMIAFSNDNKYFANFIMLLLDNSVSAPLDAAIKIVNGTSFLPLQTIIEPLGLLVVQEKQNARIRNEEIMRKKELLKERMNLLKIKHAVNKNMEVTNLNDITVWVNKQRKFPEDYSPTDLVQVNIPFAKSVNEERKKMRKEAAIKLEEMFAQAEKENVQLIGISGYRSYTTQKIIYDNRVKIYGKEAADRLSAMPGHSEHQAGLAMDISTHQLNGSLEEKFADTKEGKWVAKNAANFGFIIRYPKDKVDITGYTFEPWHLRYVGEELAKKLTEEGLTLDEYIVTPVNEQ